jgi:hypothetical protein
MSSVDDAPTRRGARRWPPVGPVVMAVMLVGVLAYVLYEAMGYSILRMRFSPLLFGVATILVAAMALVAEIRAYLVTKRRFDNPEVANRPAPAEDLTAEDESIFVDVREVQAIGWFLLLVAMFLFLGFAYGMTLFMLIFLRIYGKERWLPTVLVTVGTMATIYLLFIEFLGVRAYSGYLNLPLPFGL